MPTSRRGFLHALAPAGPSAALVAGRGREALVAESWPEPVDPAILASLPEPGEIRIDSNENPLGPGRTAMDALLRSFEDAGRYPMNSRPSMADLRAALATKFAVKPENVTLGAGSGELLRSAVRAFTAPALPLVTASPSYEQPERMAEATSVPVKRVPVDAAGRLDLAKMAEAARGAGMVFLCNPNNPTATVHPARAVTEFVARVRRESPETAILIDEAYHDYVTDPGYATATPLAMEHARVFVTRTFSKAFGMAGMRVGYAIGQAKTIEPLARWAMPYNTSALSLAAAVASLGAPAYIEAERKRNTEVRDYTTRFFKEAGFKVMESQGNFLFVDIGRPAKDFREACAKQKVFVGRDFPPLEKTHARISLGTMEEMRKATGVFSAVLGVTNTAGAAKGR